MPSPKSFLFGYFLLHVTFHLVNAQDERTPCQPQDRSAICIELGFSVCGFPQDCNEDSCGQTFDSGCQACTDENIESYSLGACLDEATVDETSVETIDTGFNIEVCPAIAQGVEVDRQFVIGTSCCGRRNDFCFDSNAVCAYFSNCQGDLCHVTKYNSCEACYDMAVDFYIPGDCVEANGEEQGEFNEEEEVMEEEKSVELEGIIEEEVQLLQPFFCDQENPPTSCGQNSVCAFLKDCFEGNCSYQAESDCAACNDSSILYYVVGEC